MWRYIMVNTENRKTELEKELNKLLGFLKYKNHGFCIKYLKSIIKDFFKTKQENTKKRRKK